MKIEKHIAPPPPAPPPVLVGVTMHLSVEEVALIYAILANSEFAAVKAGVEKMITFPPVGIPDAVWESLRGPDGAEGAQSKTGQLLYRMYSSLKHQLYPIS